MSVQYWQLAIILEAKSEAKYLSFIKYLWILSNLIAWRSAEQRREDHRLIRDLKQEIGVHTCTCIL